MRRVIKIITFLRFVHNEYTCKALREFEGNIYECLLDEDHDEQHIGITKIGTLWWNQ